MHSEVVADNDTKRFSSAVKGKKNEAHSPNPLGQSEQLLNTKEPVTVHFNVSQRDTASKATGTFNNGLDSARDNRKSDAVVTNLSSDRTSKS